MGLSPSGTTGLTGSESYTTTLRSGEAALRETVYANDRVALAAIIEIERMTTPVAGQGPQLAGTVRAASGLNLAQDFVQTARDAGVRLAQETYSKLPGVSGVPNAFAMKSDCFLCLPRQPRL